jgi:hypothetical protein
MSRIFFVARDEKKAEAAVDLFDCCVNSPFGSNVMEKCQRSVTVDLCRCFSQEKLAPGVATPWHLKQHQQQQQEHNLSMAAANQTQPPHGMQGQMQQVPHLAGITWLMHHWTEQHHPDHFGMKILELHGFVFNARQNLTASWLGKMPSPENIDNLLSIDYPIDTFTDYEVFLLELLFFQLGERKPYVSAYSPHWRNVSCLHA